MDDLTGYSSLSYLRAFPFDKIKIDQSFIRDLTANGGFPRARSCKRHSHACRLPFHADNAAEGVETEQQREMLRMLGCSEMQGYLFSRAVPKQDLLRFFPKHAQRTADAASAA